jgi:hypothetical protein
MPIPWPAKDEEQEPFMHRCMADDVMAKDFPETDQRVAVCLTQWRRAHKRPAAKSIEDFREAVRQFAKAVGPTC